MKVKKGEVKKLSKNLRLDARKVSNDTPGEGEMTGHRWRTLELSR